MNLKHGLMPDDFSGHAAGHEGEVEGREGGWEDRVGVTLGQESDFG